MKSGNLNFLEPSGPIQACNGTALPLRFTHLSSTISYTENTLLFSRITFDYVFWRDDISMKNRAIKFILMSSFVYDPTSHATNSTNYKNTEALEPELISLKWIILEMLTASRSRLPYWRNNLHFFESEYSLSCSQRNISGPVKNQSNTLHTLSPSFLKIKF